MTPEPSRAVEQRLRAAIESVPSGIIMVDAGGAIVFVNREVERLFGYSREELLGRPIDVLVPERFRTRHGDYRGDFLRAPRMRTMGAGRDLYGLRKDGTEVPVEIGLTPVVTEEGLFVVSAVVDITERKRAEDRFRVVVESAPCGMVMVDPSGRIVLVNREAERLFGYSREEMLALSIEMLVPERFRDLHSGFRKAFLKQPQARAMGAGRNLYGLRKDGSEIPVEIGLNPIETEGGAFILSSILDISARKRAEEEARALEEQLRQSQKMEAIGTLAGGIAHDFNNILGAIMAYAELIEMAVPNNPAVLADVSALLQSSEQGKQLVERILAFSRRQPRKKRPLALGEVVQEATKLLRSTLPTIIDIRSNLAMDAPRVLADPTSVHQTLMNLATNAAHSIEGAGVLEFAVEPFYARDSFVRTYPLLREGPYTLLTVRDTGRGMDAAVLERAFEPFFTTKGPGAGTGLGLSMVHNIMRDHQGAIYIESQVGHGTTAKCYFPALTSEAPETAVVVPTIPYGRGERILYVDDDDTLAEVGRRRLVALGYTVTTANNGPEAIRLMTERPGDFDLVITDYWMPQMTGTDVAARINHIKPEMPILMLTGYGDDLPRETTASAGIKLVLRKPVTARQLGEAVSLALKGNS